MELTVSLLKYKVVYVNQDKEVKTELFYKQGKRIRSNKEAQDLFLRSGYFILNYDLIGRFQYNIKIDKELLK